MLARNVRTGTDAVSGLPSQAILSVSSVDVMKVRMPMRSRGGSGPTSGSKP